MVGQVLPRTNLLLSSKITDDLSSRFSALSSGSRLTKAAVDPAGLAVSLELSQTVRGNAAAARGLSDSISAVSIAYTSLGSSADIAGRLSELAAQSSNGTFLDSQRQILNAEYQSLREEMGRINGSSKFNGINIFGNDGLLASLGAAAVTTDPEALKLSPSIDTLQNARAALDSTKNAQEFLSKGNGELGGIYNKLEQSMQSYKNAEPVLKAATARITDANIAAEVSTSISLQIQSQIGVALQAQANIQAQSAAGVLI
jgi:flagellin